MARADHVALRVADRKKTAQLFIDAFGYRIQQEFPINFKDGSICQCIALEPPEKLEGVDKIAWKHISPLGIEYHLPVEYFITDGSPDSIVGKWVANRGGIGSIHHIAYQVESVEKTMEEWKQKGYAEFASEKPIVCPEDKMIQVFTRPSALTGFIFEFIERGEFGFCQKSVEALIGLCKDFK